MSPPDGRGADRGRAADEHALGRVRRGAHGVVRLQQPGLVAEAVPGPGAGLGAGRGAVVLPRLPFAPV